MSLAQRQVGDALPGYDIGGELGRGGWGVVLAARHRQLGRDVAVKQLPAAFAADPTVVARFVAEARLLAQLDHPHVVPIYDYVESDGLCLLVIEALPGGTVWDRFTTEGLTPATACAIALATCAGLSAAHAQRILHRDIKPENMMFAGNGVLKVTDFGIAKVIGGDETMATVAGDVVGTPAYIAPEQARGLELSPATDVYAVATMLYEFLAGRLPFADDGDAMSLLFKHAFEQPTPLLEAAPTVPRSIAEVVMAGLQTDPAQRPDSAEAFGVALAEACTVAWGPGWLATEGTPVMGASRILAATERSLVVPGADLAAAPSPAAPPTEARPVVGAAPAPPTEARPAAAAPAPPTEARPASAAPAPPTEARPVPGAPPDAGAIPGFGPAPAAPSAPAFGAAPVFGPPPAAGSPPPPIAPAPVPPASGPPPTPVAPATPLAAPGPPVRPSMAVHTPVLDLADVAAADLVPVREIVQPPPRAVVHILVTLVLLVLTIVGAMVGLGTPAHHGTATSGEIMVAGVDAASGSTVKLDLEKPVPIVVTQPVSVPGGDLTPASVSLSLCSLGVCPVKVHAPAATTAGRGSVRVSVASLDVGNRRYLLGGRVTAKVEVVDGTLPADRGGSVAEQINQETAASTSPSGFLTAPGGVAVALLLFLLAYAESSLRFLRRGRRKVSATVTLVLLGAVLGVDATLAAMVAGLHELTVVGVAVSAVIGALAGLVGASASWRGGRRRRYERVASGRTGNGA